MHFPKNLCQVTTNSLLVAAVRDVAGPASSTISAAAVTQEHINK